MKKTGRKKLIISVLAVVIFITAVTACILIKKHKAINDSALAGLEETKYMPVEIDISKVTLDDEVGSLLDNDEEKMDKYKKLIAEFNPADEYLEKINSEAAAGYEIEDILICYNFLNENYEKIDMMDDLLSKNKKGKDWSKIFESYYDKNKEFEPTDFKEGYIGSVLNGSSLSTDDIMIADKISQKCSESIDDLIAKRKSGEDWRTIKTELGIVNLEEGLTSVAFSDNDINKYKGIKDLSNDEIVKGIIIARKLNASEEKVMDSLIKGKTQSEIYADIYKEKYEN